MAATRLNFAALVVDSCLVSVQYFEREAERNGERVVFTLYRCVLQTRERRWYISIVPSHRKEPGTTDDMDFYYCHCTSMFASEGKMDVSNIMGWGL